MPREWSDEFAQELLKRRLNLLRPAISVGILQLLSDVPYFSSKLGPGWWQRLYQSEIVRCLSTGDWKVA